MARKSNDDLFNSFLADIKAIAPGIEELVKDEKVAAKLKESVLARADYSSQMDELKKARTEMESFLATEKTKIDGWVKYHTEAQQQYATVEDKLKKYVEEYGELDDNEQRREAKNHGMTKEDFEKALGTELQKREAAYLKFADDLTDLKIEHRQKYGERLDTDALYKIAGEQNLPLTSAYTIFTADKNEALRKKEFDDAIKKAKDEGAREALSQHNIPQVPSNPDYVHVLDHKDAPRTERDRVSAAVSDFLGRQK